MSTAHIVKAKYAAETVNNSTTLQDDDHLAWDVKANENYILTGWLYCSAILSTHDIKIALTLPTGTSMVLQAGIAEDLAVTAGTCEGETETVSGTGIGLDVVYNGSNLAIVQFRVSIAVGATAGTVQLQWAQNSAVASNLTVDVGSFGILTRV